MPCQKCAVLAVPALGAEALVFHIVHRVDGDLRTFKDKLAVDLAPVADGLASAGTNRFEFLNRVRNFQKPRRAGKAAHHEISPQTVADNGNTQVHRDQKQLVGLLGREELALVAEHTGNFAMGGLVGLDQLNNVHLGGDQLIDLAADAQAGDDGVLPLGVNGRLQDQHAHAALFIIVGDLHECGSLAAVHCAVSEI